MEVAEATLQSAEEFQVLQEEIGGEGRGIPSAAFISERTWDVEFISSVIRVHIFHRRINARLFVHLPHRYSSRPGLGLCAINTYSIDGTPPCTACPTGEVSGSGATSCTRLGKGVCMRVCNHAENVPYPVAKVVQSVADATHCGV